MSNFLKSIFLVSAALFNNENEVKILLRIILYKRTESLYTHGAIICFKMHKTFSPCLFRL